MTAHTQERQAANIQWLVRYAILVAAVAAYLFSLVIPVGYVYYHDGRQQQVDRVAGLPVLGEFWRQFPFCPAGLGHPAFWVAVVLVLLRRFRVGVWMASAGLLCALNMSGMQNRTIVLGNQPHTTGGWDGVAPGYYLWLGSLLLALVAAAIGMSANQDVTRDRA
jgi:hypothetical protein